MSPVDENWAADTLSDDEIDLPKGCFDLDEEDEDEIGVEKAGEDAWTELGLDKFSADQSPPLTTDVALPPGPTSP